MNPEMEIWIKSERAPQKHYYLRYTQIWPLIPFIGRTKSLSYVKTWACGLLLLKHRQRVIMSFLPSLQLSEILFVSQRSCALTTSGFSCIIPSF